MISLGDFIKKKFDGTSKLIVCIGFDALLFCVWLFIAFGLFLLSDWMAQFGFNDFFLNAFKWSSSGTLFLLTLLYAVGDIIDTIKEIWKEMDKIE